MYTFDGLISQEGEIADCWAPTYLRKFELGFPPTRCIMEISDLAHPRAWILDNVFSDYRSAQDPRNIHLPLGKLWESRLRSHLVGDLKLVLPAQNPGIYEHIRTALDLARYPGRVALEWFGEDAFVRVATRAAPSSGKW